MIASSARIALFSILTYMSICDPMATHTVSSTSDTAILSHLTWPADDALAPAAAEGWLAVRFDKQQLDRMHQLATKNQDGKLTAKEKHELEQLPPRRFSARPYALQGPPIPEETPGRSTNGMAARLHSSRPRASRRTLRILPSASARDAHPLEIDHIISRKHHGRTVASNLALSLWYCNSFKGPDISGLDPPDGES